MPGISFGDNRLGVALRQVLARSKHACTDKIETSARNQPGNDPAGARLAHRIWRDNNVGKLLGLHVFFERLC